MLASIIFAISACTDYQSRYGGDGHFIDHGYFAAKSRYTIDFGRLSFGSKMSKEVCISRAPNTTFTFGLELEFDKKVSAVLPDEMPDPVVRIALRGEGDLIFEHQGSLGDWTWSYSQDSSMAFLYFRSNGGTQHKLNQHLEYCIDLDVLRGDRSAMNYRARLVGYSAGWK